MLPLHVRQGLPEYNPMPLGHEQAATGAAPLTHVPPPVFDIQTIINAVILALTEHTQGLKVGLQEDIHTAVAQGLAGIQCGGVGHLNPAPPQMQSPSALSTDLRMADFTMASPPRASGHPSEPYMTDIYGGPDDEDGDDLIMSSNVTTAPTTDLSDSRGTTELEGSEDEDYAAGRKSTPEVVGKSSIGPSKGGRSHFRVQPSPYPEHSFSDSDPFDIQSAPLFQDSSSAPHSTSAYSPVPSSFTQMQPAQSHSKSN